MGIVYIDACTMLLGDLGDSPKRSKVAIHTEYAVCENPDVLVGRLVLFCFIHNSGEVLNILVLEYRSISVAEPHTINDRPMIQFIRDEEVSSSTELGYKAFISHEPGLVSQRGGSLLKLRKTSV